MLDPFLIALRESFQCSILLSLVLFHPLVREDRTFRSSIIAGVSFAFLLGFLAGAVPLLSKNLGTHETWTFWRHVAEAIVFYSSVALLIRRPAAPPWTAAAGLFLLGFFLFFFESRGMGFFMHDLGAINDRLPETMTTGLAGVFSGFLPLVLFRKHIVKLLFEKAFTAPSLLMVIGALRFGFGGLSELGGENILVPLQRGLLLFISEAVKSMQSALLITEHPFMDVVFSGLARYLGSDRTALFITMLFLLVPPVFILITLFARPDPPVGDIQAGAQKRHTIAFFRKELSYLTVPVLAAFIVLVVLLHAVNISLNPLYDPAPLPVREAEDGTSIRIPVSGTMGDLADRKLRKFVYYHGKRQVLFLAVVKADGTVGVALDQCEVCRPADWNKDAKGYAQRGGHLVCKYCMTPIATATVNTPGGCNPIPVPFRVEDDSIALSLTDLISAFDKAESLDRKETHL